MINAYWEALAFELPPTEEGAGWRRWIDTSLASPDDICEKAGSAVRRRPNLSRPASFDSVPVRSVQITSLCEVVRERQTVAHSQIKFPFARARRARTEAISLNWR